MNKVFRDILRKLVLVFFNDILVYSSSSKAYLEHMEIVLKILQKEKLLPSSQSVHLAQGKLII